MVTTTGTGTTGRVAFIKRCGIPPATIVLLLLLRMLWRLLTIVPRRPGRGSVVTVGTVGPLHIQFVYEGGNQ